MTETFAPYQVTDHDISMEEYGRRCEDGTFDSRPDFWALPGREEWDIIEARRARAERTTYDADGTAHQSYACEHCGRKVNTTTGWAVVPNQRGALLLPEEQAAAEISNDTMGVQYIGSTCGRSIPKEFRVRLSA